MILIVCKSMAPWKGNQALMTSTSSSLRSPESSDRSCVIAVACWVCCSKTQLTCYHSPLSAYPWSLRRNSVVRLSAECTVASSSTFPVLSNEGSSTRQPSKKMSGADEKQVAPDSRAVQELGPNPREGEECMASMLEMRKVAPLQNMPRQSSRQHAPQVKKIDASKLARPQPLQAGLPYYFRWFPSPLLPPLRTDSYSA